MSSSRSLRAEYEQREQDLLHDLEQLVSLLRVYKNGYCEGRLLPYFVPCLRDLKEMVMQNRPRSEKVSVGDRIRNPYKGGMGSPINDCSFSHDVKTLLDRVKKNFYIYEDNYDGFRYRDLE